MCPPSSIFFDAPDALRAIPTRNLRRLSCRPPVPSSLLPPVLLIARAIQKASRPSPSSSSSPLPLPQPCRALLVASQGAG